MEGVGARLGRSSTRYGPATVFSGPVRRWKKKWVHLTSSASNAPPSSAQNNGNNSSHLLLFKWTPLSQSNNGSNGNNNGNDKDDSSAVSEEPPPKRKFRYVPVSVIEEQTKEEADKVAGDNPNDTSTANLSQQGVKSEDPVAKPNANDASLEENQDKAESRRVEHNEASLDLSLCLKTHDGEKESK